MKHTLATTKTVIVMRLLKWIKRIFLITVICGVQFFQSCVEPEDTGSIYGNISNALSEGAGERVANATVSLEGPDSRTISTGDNGQYQFDDIEVGVYTVSVEHNDYINAESQQIPVSLGDFIQVDISMTPQGAIDVTPSSLNFGADQSELSFTIKNVISTDFSYEMDIANSWLSLNKTSGSLTSGNSVSIAASIDRKALELGNNEGAFTVNIPGRSSFTINVFVLHDPQIPLAVTPVLLDFSTAVTNLELSVTNTSNDIVNYEIQSPGSWISLSQTKGVLTANNTNLINVTVNRSAITTGSHEGTIIFNVVDEGSKAITVLATKLDATAAVLVLDEGVLDFGKSIDERVLTITNEGDNSLVWELNTSDSWISASEIIGSLPPNNKQEVTIYVNRNDRSDGEYDSKVFFTSNGGNGEVTIKMEVDNTNTGGNGEMVVTSGLRAYYTFDDGTVKDEMGNFTAVPIGVTPSDDSPVSGGKSMEFDGVDDFIQISGNPIFNSNAQRIHAAFSFWVKSSSEGALFSVPLSSDDQRNEFLTGFVSERVRHSIGQSVSWPDSKGDFDFNIRELLLNAQWHHLLISYDGSSKKVSMYIDGVQLAQENYLITGTLNAELSRIGADYYTYTIHDDALPKYLGLLDNIRIYNRPLTSSEVEEIFNAKQ